MKFLPEKKRIKQQIIWPLCNSVRHLQSFMGTFRPCSTPFWYFRRGWVAQWFKLVCGVNKWVGVTNYLHETNFTKVRSFLEHSCAIISSFKIVIIFKNTSAHFVLISADVLLKMITILKELSIACVLKIHGL